MSNVAYVDPMLPRMSDSQLQTLIEQAQSLLSFRRDQRERRSSVVTMPGIALRVAHTHGLGLEDVLGFSREAPIVEARQQAMWEIRQVRTPNGQHRYSFPKIGQFFGRDHATVIHGVRRHGERMAEKGAQ